MYLIIMGFTLYVMVMDFTLVNNVTSQLIVVYRSPYIIVMDFLFI